MPQPGVTDLVLVNPLLTNLSVAYMQTQTEYVADRVFPSVDVDVQGGQYSIYNKGDWFRTEAGVRAPATESPGTGWNVSAASFFVQVYAVHKDIDDQTAAVASSRQSGGFNLRSDATRFVTGQMLLKRDLLWVASFFSTGVWTRERAGVAAGPTGTQFLRWDVASSTPITDIKSEVLLMQQTTGFSPNTLVLGPNVWYSLSEHSTILARIQYVERAIATEDLIASLVGIDRVVVARAIQNTANEGAADSFSFVMGKHALLAYSAPNPGLLQPSAGYTFNWTGYPPEGGGQNGVSVRDFRMEHLRATRVEGEFASQPFIVSQDLGTLFYTAVS